MNIIFFILISWAILLTPILIEAETETVRIDNKTFIINIKSTNPITIERENDTALENILQKLAQKEEPKWREGDILVASSTIFAFFAFTSFLVIRFESKKRNIQVELMQLVLGFIGGIQISHLAVIIVIMRNRFDQQFYSDIIFLTIFLLILILLAVRKIIILENEGVSRTTSTVEMVDDLTKELIKKDLITQQMADHVSGLERENKKLQRESGEY